jgi:hypothetical protein
MSAISSIATMPGGKDTTILLAGWNGQLYQASSTNLSSWASPSNTGNYHFTAVDYRPNLSGTAVTDNGVHCTFAPIPSALVPGYITPAGEALWTTIAATSGDWIGGGFNPNAPLYDPDFNQGNGTWSSGIAMTMGTVINGTYTPLSSLPESDQVWFSGARSPSGNARMGGYRFRNPSNPYATPVYRQ